MLAEFFIGKDLDHPHIVKYNYFIKWYDPVSKTHDFHIIMEYLDGGDIDHFLKGYPNGVTNEKLVKTVAQ